MPSQKVKTVGISHNLLMPFATVLAGGLTVLIVSHHWGVIQTTSVLSAAGIFIVGYIVGPTPADSLLDKLRINKKLLAAVVTAAVGCAISVIDTGVWNEDQTSVLLLAVAGLLVAMIARPDPVAPVEE